MFTQDPRLAFSQTPFGAFSYSPIYNTGYNPLSLYGQPYLPTAPFAYGAPVASVQTPVHAAGLSSIPEIAHLTARIEEMRHQLVCMSNLFQADLSSRTAAHTHGLGYPQAFNHLQSGLPFQYPQNFMSPSNILPLRLRESDSHIYCDIYLPTLTIADVEVEVSGNRIICRTRVPVAPMGRFWAATQLPRGLEVFDLPDGRIEFNWLSHLPIVAKDVEATFREGFLCICIPKTEVTTKPHAVKVQKETATGRRTEMNS